MEPVHGRKNSPVDFKKVNDVLFPNGTDKLEIYEWTTDWSDFLMTDTNGMVRAAGAFMTKVLTDM